MKKIVLKGNITTNIEHEHKNTGTSVRTVSLKKPSFGLSVEI